MKRRIHLALAFLIAPCILAAVATEVTAGPLPLDVLGAMRARTVKLIEGAQRQLRALETQDRDVFEAFARATADPSTLRPGAYEKLLGDYFQQSAEIGANRAAQEAVIAALSSHLAEVDQQIHAWRLLGLTEAEISTQLTASDAAKPMKIKSPPATQIIPFD